jgi:hypothetical protein
MPIFYLPYLWYIKVLLCQLWPLAAIFSLLLIIPCPFRCLQDHLRELSRQTFYQMLLQPSPAYQQLALSANEAWEKPSAFAPRDLTNFQIPAEPPLLSTPLSSRKQLVRLVPIIPTKGWNIRSLEFLQRAESPEANTETRAPWFMTTCKTPLIVSLLAKSQELPASQLAMHVDPFYHR